MYIIIEQLFYREQLDLIDDALGQAVYLDGMHTAGHDVKNHKHNMQADPKGARDANSIALKILSEHKDFQQAAFPKAVNVPIFSMYHEGMEYGPHVDNALMRKQHGIMRTDLALTVFMSDPKQYEGGELCVNVGDANEQEFKLPAGSAILYPANTLHCVKPVTKGFRKAMVTWIQSFFPDHDQRKILYDMLKLKETAESEQIGHIYTKLARMWAEV